MQSNLRKSGLRAPRDVNRAHGRQGRRMLPALLGRFAVDRLLRKRRRRGRMLGCCRARRVGCELRHFVFNVGQVEREREIHVDVGAHLAAARVASRIAVAETRRFMASELPMPARRGTRRDGLGPERRAVFVRDLLRDEQGLEIRRSAARLHHRADAVGQAGDDDVGRMREDSAYVRCRPRASKAIADELFGLLARIEIPARQETSVLAAKRFARALSIHSPVCARSVEGTTASRVATTPTARRTVRGVRALQQAAHETQRIFVNHAVCAVNDRATRGARRAHTALSAPQTHAPLRAAVH